MVDVSLLARGREPIRASDGIDVIVRHRGVSTAAALRPLGSFRRADDGATAVEFGLVAAPALMILCAILAVGLNFFMVASLDHATLVGARALATGAVSTAGTSASSFKLNTICPALPSVFSCSDVYVNVAVVAPAKSPSGYYALVNAAQSALIQPALDATKNTFCPGTSSQYIVLQVLYPAPYLFSFLTPTTPAIYNNRNVAVMMSSTTFLSEPYSGAQAYTGC